jgi:hypothetical protein
MPDEKTNDLASVIGKIAADNAGNALRPHLTMNSHEQPQEIIAAKVLMGDSKFLEALKALDKFLQHCINNPGNPRHFALAHMLSGVALMHLEDYAKANTNFENAIRILELLDHQTSATVIELAELRYHQGLVSVAMGEIDKAREHFQAVIDMKRLSGSLRGQAWLALANAVHTLGDQNEQKLVPPYVENANNYSLSPADKCFGISIVASHYLKAGDWEQLLEQLGLLYQIEKSASDVYRQKFKQLLGELLKRLDISFNNVLKEESMEKEFALAAEDYPQLAASFSDSQWKELCKERKKIVHEQFRQLVFGEKNPTLKRFNDWLKTLPSQKIDNEDKAEIASAIQYFRDKLNGKLIFKDDNGVESECTITTAKNKEYSRTFWLRSVSDQKQLYERVRFPKVFLLANDRDLKPRKTNE